MATQEDVVAADRLISIRCHEIAPVIGDLEANTALIEAAIADAMASGVQLLVLPELATSGYHLSPGEATECAITPDDDVFSQWAALLRPSTVLVLGFAEAAEDRIFNSAAVVTCDGVQAVHRKTHLWDTEKEIFVPGNIAPRVIDSPVGLLGVLICYELEFPELPRALALAGADMIAVPTNWPLLDRPAGEHAPEVVQAMAAARASGVAIACCDRRGEERTTMWTEGTTVIGTDGWPVGGKDESGRLNVALSIDAGRHQISTRNHILQDRRPDLYR